MSTVNAANTTTGRYNPSSADRKLEKQLAQAKANQNSLSAIPGNWKVKKDPKLGTHFVLMMGKDETEHVQHFVIHRLIGQDAMINEKEAWVMSLASDIAGFQAHAEFGGKSKAVKLLKTLKNKIALEANTLIIEPDGTEKYPDGNSREETLDLARAASDAHAKVKGGHHFGEWILYLPPEAVTAELAIQASTAGNPRYMLEASGILKEYSAFRTSLINGMHQQEVPYLYGVAEKDVIRTVYNAMIGVLPPVGEKPGFITGILPHKVFTDYVAGDDPVRQKLVRLLQSHAEAQKAYNIANSNVKSAKSKEEKAMAIKAFDLKDKELDESTAKILNAEKEGKYPTIKATTHFELGTKPKARPKQARKVIAEPEKVTDAAEDTSAA